jgi:hypothetical protein
VNAFDANIECGRCKHRVNPLVSHGSKNVVQVDDELEFLRLHDWQVGGFGALEDAADIDCRKLSAMLVP